MADFVVKGKCWSSASIACPILETDQNSIEFESVQIWSTVCGSDYLTGKRGEGNL